MKRNIIALAFGCAVVSALAQASPETATPSSPADKSSPSLPAPTGYATVERGPDHRVWERLTYERSPGGTLLAKPHRYKEIASGMHYQDAKGQWQESKEIIRPAAKGGAEAVEGPHQVQFPYDIYNGTIRIAASDGTQLKCRPLCISYFDGSKSCAIAELTNSVGQILPPGNRVIYTNAFTDFAADLLCTYRKGSFECDLIFREQAPAPEEFGLDPSSSRLQLLTEFFDTPQPKQIPSAAKKAGGLADATLQFGKTMKMIHGKAFAVGDQSQPANHKKEVPVSKTWTHLEGRTFLIEEVPVQQITTELNALPAPANSETGATGTGSGHAKGSASRVLPPARLVEANTNILRMARVDRSGRSGVALDYTIVESQDSFTFQGDTTYYVSDDVNISDVIIEGNTVIKHFTNNASINILGSVNCLTTPYRPAVFTSFEDSTVGESLSTDSAPCTGTFSLTIWNNYYYDLEVWVYDDSWNAIVDDVTIPSGNSAEFSFTAGLGQHYWFDSYDDYYWNEYSLDFWPTLLTGNVEVDQSGNVGYYESGNSICTPPATSPTAALTLSCRGALHDLRICNADLGVSGSWNYSVTNLQFRNCKRALQSEDGANLYAGNILMSHVDTAFYGQNFHATCEHLTLDQGTALTGDPDGASSTSALTLVNSLVTGVESSGVVPLTTNCVVRLSTNANVFQICGGGAYYLANSTYRQSGTTGIDSGLLAQLRSKTTYPPIVYSNASIYSITNLSPQAQRDCFGAPDLGWHYAPLDYAFGGSHVYTNLTFSPGTAVGWFRTDSGWYHSGQGIHVGDYKILTFDGRVDAPCYWVRCNIVQEGGTGQWDGGYGPGGITGWANQNAGNASASPEVHLRFTRLSMFPADNCHIRDDWGYITVRGTHSEVYSSGIGSYALGCYMTNCLFDRSGFGNNEGHPGNQLHARNCTWHGGIIDLIPSQTVLPVSVRECAFDGATIHCNLTHLNPRDFDYNAFTNGMTRFPVGGDNDVLVDNFNWQTSWLGNFYLPTYSDLINKGSAYANLIGLYQFTTQTDQSLEANSLVDIGYHHVAVDGNGNPADTNQDGIPDYLSDANGNGLVDSGEVGWNINGDLGLKVVITRPRNNSILP